MKLKIIVTGKYYPPIIPLRYELKVLDEDDAIILKKECLDYNQLMARISEQIGRME